MAGPRPGFGSGLDFPNAPRIHWGTGAAKSKAFRLNTSVVRKLRGSTGVSEAQKAESIKFTKFAVSDHSLLLFGGCLNWRVGLCSDTGDTSKSSLST